MDRNSRRQLGKSKSFEHRNGTHNEISPAVKSGRIWAAPHRMTAEPDPSKRSTTCGLQGQISCGLLWGGNCNLGLERSRNFVCEVPSHRNNGLAELLEIALDQGFDPTRSVEFQGLRRGYDLLKELACFYGVSRSSRLHPGSGVPHTDLLDRLASHPQWRVRGAVAKFPNLSRAAIDRLSDDVVPAVRGWVANNAATPISVLERLCLDIDYVVRFRLAQNLDLPIKLFARLMNDTELPVRRILATNSTTPFFYDVADMRFVLGQANQYSWTILLSRNPVPSPLLGVLAMNAERFEDVSVSLFARSNQANLEFLLTLIASKRVTASPGLSQAVSSLLKPRVPRQQRPCPATLGFGLAPPLSALA